MWPDFLVTDFFFISNGFLLKVTLFCFTNCSYSSFTVKITKLYIIVGDCLSCKRVPGQTYKGSNVLLCSDISLLSLDLTETHNQSCFESHVLTVLTLVSEAELKSFMIQTLFPNHKVI